MKKAVLCLVSLTSVLLVGSLAAAQDAALIQAARKEAKIVWYTSLAT